VKTQNDEMFVSADICWSINIMINIGYPNTVLPFGTFSCRGQACNVFRSAEVKVA